MRAQRVTQLEVSNVSQEGDMGSIGVWQGASGTPGGGRGDFEGAPGAGGLFFF